MARMFGCKEASSDIEKLDLYSLSSFENPQQKSENRIFLTKITKNRENKGCEKKHPEIKQFGGTREIS